MPFVLDASVTACWAFQDEEHPNADLALARIRKDQAISPGLWWFEIRNILVVNERRKRITESQSAAFLRDVAMLSIRLDFAPENGEVLRLARTHKLSVYDAAYLELAQRAAVPLATLDEALIRAARAEQIPFIGEHRQP
jgi:predicted nucleic acid-binding protein